MDRGVLGSDLWETIRVEYMRASPFRGTGWSFYSSDSRSSPGTGPDEKDGGKGPHTDSPLSRTDRHKDTVEDEGREAQVKSHLWCIPSPQVYPFPSVG